MGQKRHGNLREKAHFKAHRSTEEHEGNQSRQGREKVDRRVSAGWGRQRSRVPLGTTEHLRSRRRISVDSSRRRSNRGNEQIHAVARSPLLPARILGST